MSSLKISIIQATQRTLISGRAISFSKSIVSASPHHESCNGYGLAHGAMYQSSFYEKARHSTWS